MEARAEVRRTLIEVARNRKFPPRTDNEPDDWRMHHDWRLVLRALLAWQRSNAALPPTLDEIASYDSKWLADVHTMADLLAFQEDGIGE